MNTDKTDGGINRMRDNDDSIYHFTVFPAWSKQIIESHGPLPQSWIDEDGNERSIKVGLNSDGLGTLIGVRECDSSCEFASVKGDI